MTSLRPCAVSVFSLASEGPSDTPDHCYVLHMAAPRHGPPVFACSGSNGAVRLYDASSSSAGSSLRVVATAAASSLGPHVTGVSCSAGPTPLVAACSEEGKVLVWDPRDGLRAPALSLRVPGSAGDTLCVSLRDDCRALAAGRGEKVVVWDLAAPRSPCRSYAEVHTDDVTAVAWHPSAPEKLLSGSTDGLVCATDVSAPAPAEPVDEDGEPDDGDALFLVLSVGNPVETFSVLGAADDLLGVVTCDEQFSIWQLDRGTRAMLLGSAREAVSGPAYTADHIVGCHYDAALGAAVLVSASTSGAAAVHAVSLETGQAVQVGQLPASQAIGHMAQLRCYAILGNAMATGGEDSRVCLWGSASDSLVAAAPQPTEQMRDDDDDDMGTGRRKSSRSLRASPYARS
jgi:WD40 repeat protein